MMVRGPGVREGVRVRVDCPSALSCTVPVLSPVDSSTVSRSPVHPTRPLSTSLGRAPGVSLDVDGGSCPFRRKKSLLFLSFVRKL